MQYGSPKFLEQHDAIVQLNLQAHQNAAAHADEFVMEALVSHAKMDMLVHGLLVAEVRQCMHGSAWNAGGALARAQSRAPA